jgi:3-dehydroquinate synthase
MELVKEIKYSDTSSLVGFIDSKELWEKKADLYVADENTARFLNAEQREKSLILPPGEEAKTFSSVEKILSAAVEQQLNRSSLILGIGGGVICDMTAFAASLFMRGCRVELVPTTLLAMVDAAVGGKTGVDFRNYKNMMGTFYPAEKVNLALFTLEHLPQKEFLCGLAEAIKTALIGDEELFILLEDNRDSVLSRDLTLIKEIIGRCVNVKAKIVQEDLKEKGTRVCLNLGHTFGHALESVSGFSNISHGEAVAWGMVKASQAALNRGDIDRDFYHRIVSLIDIYGYKKDYSFSYKALLEAMGHDKKSQSGTIRFILPAGMEKYLITPLKDSLLQEVLQN